MNRIKLLAVVTVVLAIAALGTVHAQQWGGPRHDSIMSRAAMHGDVMGRGHHMGRWMRSGGGCGMTQHLDGRLAFLKAELKITPEQEQLWNAYASVVRDNAQSAKDRCSEMKSMGEGQQPALPERLDAREKWMEARLEALRTATRALKPLYAALGDEQKKAADELIHPMGMI